MSSRCACCDAVLTESEIVWYPAPINEHEDLCHYCRKLIFDSESSVTNPYSTVDGDVVRTYIQEKYSE